jgi:cell division protein FtsZ
MVHRIQNRNPGYSDFSNMGPTPSFNFSANNSGPISHGANALKLENEVVSENISQQSVNDDINQVNNQYHEELLKSHQAEDIVENTSNDEEVSFAQEATQELETLVNEESAKNDLSEFGVDSNEPDLFNNNNETSSSDDLLSSDDDQEDDLEIPAFLRRQKN